MHRTEKKEGTEVNPDSSVPFCPGLDEERAQHAEPRFRGHGHRGRPRLHHQRHHRGPLHATHGQRQRGPRPHVRSVFSTRSMVRKGQHGNFDWSNFQIDHLCFNEV